jgi:hypothetical protein
LIGLVSEQVAQLRFDRAESFSNQMFGQAEQMGAEVEIERDGPAG